MQASAAGLMIGYAAGHPVDMRATLQTYPIKLKTVRQYAGEVLA